MSNMNPVYNSDSDDDNGYRPVDDGNDTWKWKLALIQSLDTNASTKRKHNNKDNNSCSQKKSRHTTALYIRFG